MREAEVAQWQLCEDERCEEAEDGLRMHFHLVLTHPGRPIERCDMPADRHSTPHRECILR